MDICFSPTGDGTLPLLLFSKETNNWRPAQGETPSMEIPSSDWRSQLQPEARQRIVNKIMDTLRRHLPVAAPVGMTELKKIAARFEEKIYAAAVNQPDYLRKISLKILSMEAKIQQNTPMNSQNGVNQNSTDAGLLVIPPQVNCQGQPLPQIRPVGSPSRRQQILPQNLQNNTHASIQGSSNLSSPLSITGLTQSTITNFGHTSSMQNMPRISHSSVNNSLAQGTTTDIYANAQRHMQGRQQQQSQLMKKIHYNALLQPSMQQQQQQSLLQKNLFQPSQQSKNMSQTQQQLQQPSISLLQSQGQQSYQLSSQKHMMSQFQSQGQLQQPLAMQQQSNSMQRIPLSTLLQPQSALEQQMQFMKSQRGIPELSYSTSMDSTTQTGHNAADWQEEIYQKIQVVKEAHLAELQEFHQKISQRYQQNDMMPLEKQSGNFEKLKSFKVLLERLLAFLQISKNSIAIGLKEKLPNYEKQIIGLSNLNKKQKIMPLPLQGQQQLHHPGGLAQSTPQHHPSQVVQMQQQENLGNQVHQMNMTGSITSMQQGRMGSLQQSGVGRLPNSVGASQQTNLKNLSQSSMSSLQPTGTSVQNSDVLQQQHLKQQQQEHLLQNQQLLKQQLHQRQIQQQLLQQQQRQQLQQQMHLQQKQHQPSQLPEHQMSQHPMNELNELKARQRSSIKPGIYQQNFTGVQRPNYHPQQLKSGASFPISSPQKLQASSPQISHHSSPQIEHALLTTRAKSGTPMQSTGSPFVVPSPSPSTPIAPSPIPGDSEKLLFAAISLPTTGHTTNQQAASAPLQSQSISVATPGILASPLLAEFPSQEGNLTNARSRVGASESPIPGDSEKLLFAAISLPTTGQTTNQQAASAPLQSQTISVATPGILASPLLAEFPSQEGNLTNATSRVGASERPFERLIKAVQSLSPTALSSAVSDLSSVVSMTDRIAGSAPGNGSRASVGEDLVAMTKCSLQARNFMSQDGGTTTKKTKRRTSAMPLNNVSSAGSVNDNFMKFGSLDSSELESMETSRVKRRKLEVNHALHREIRAINQQLIDTVISICDEDSDSAAAATSGGVGEGTIIECSFNAVSFSPSLKAHFASMHMCPIAPLRLLVPSNYPKCSPLLLDKLPIETSKEFEDPSIKAKSGFSISLRGLSQPMSLGEMARTWDTCARKVIVEYVQLTGGGSFSSTFGAWENCVGA